MKTQILIFAFAFMGNLFFSQGISKEQKKEMDNYLFQESFKSVSPKKPSTVILKNGTSHVGFCRDLDKKQGQIYSITIADTVSGNQQTFEANQIQELRLYAGGFAKVMKMDKYFSTGNASNWGKKSAKSMWKNDEIPFLNEKLLLPFAREEKEYLMQLINPNFANKIQVYADPRAQETSTVKVGGFGVTGGVTKSFYVKKNDRIFLLEKKNFKEEYQNLFGDNAEFMAKYPADAVEWNYLSWLINEYDKMSS